MTDWKSKYLEMKLKYVNAKNKSQNYIQYGGAFPFIYSQNLYLISHTIMDHCKNFNLTCLNLAQESGLEYNDFYDHMHLNRAGSLKVSNYIYENLFKNNNLN